MLRSFLWKGLIPIIREIRSEMYSDEAFRIFSGCMFDPSPKKYAALVKRWIDDPGTRCFGSLENNSLTGILVVCKTEIAGIAVAPSFRGRGIGRSLIRHAVSALSLSRLNAETDDEAVDFYRRCGFRCTAFERRFSDGVCRRWLCRWEISE